MIPVSSLLGKNLSRLAKVKSRWASQNVIRTNRKSSRAMAEGTRSSEGKTHMFQKHGDGGYMPVIEGIERKTTVYGERTLMSMFRMKKESRLPLHSHPHEQTGYLVSGRIRLLVGSEAYDVLPGDTWCIPGGREHCAEILEDSLALEVFSPVREDYLPK